MPNADLDMRSEVASIPPREENRRTMAEPNGSDFKFESTKEGDVVVIESSPQKRRHRRDLSAHFLDATRLTDEVGRNKEAHGAAPERPTDRILPSSSSSSSSSRYSPASSSKPNLMASASTVGSKHRRGFSGDVSNPAVAHRRTNSRGGSAHVDRSHYYHGSYYPPPTHYYMHGHRRENSGGLDLLSAAADVSKEELAVAAGPRHMPSAPSGFHKGRKQSPTPVTSSYKYRRTNSYPYHNPTLPRAGHYSPYPQYYAPSHYHQPHHHGLPPPSQPGSYPAQYAPSRRHYFNKNTYPPQPAQPKEAERIDTEERLFQKEWRPPRNSATTGVQTYVTTIAVGEGDRTLMPAPPGRAAAAATADNLDLQEPKPPIPATIGHHRKMSSYSSLGTLMSAALLPEPSGAQSPGHQRSNSSSVSFLHGLDDVDFFQTVGAQSSQSSRSFGKVSANQGHSLASAQQSPRATEPTVPVASTDQVSGRVLASGGTSKRIRRKCTIDGCPNRVVQGGLCISHGAKRKTCKHPGCNKNVKKAGLCSTHGPARKRCEVEDCTKVAVQGGRCIAHGARKKLCSVENCSKQAILAGMCKKHHDNHKGTAEKRNCRKVAPDLCVIIDSKSKAETPTHTRGLSIFQEMSPESVRSYLSEDSNSVHPLKADD